MKRCTRIGLLLCWTLLSLATPALAAIGTLSLAQIEALTSRPPADGQYQLIDTRPDIKYMEGHLPWAQSLPFQEMNERRAELPTDKAQMLVFYCGGVKCDLSQKAAELAVRQGYSQVFTFPGGEPAWREAGHSLWVATGYVKLLLNDRERVALLVDARPDIKYLEGTVPGAINLPFADWEKRHGLLPADKKTRLIFFCGGLKCDLSHKSAAKARELGYADVRVYAEGWPVWKEQSTRAFALVNPKNPAAAMVAEAPVNTGEIGPEEFVKLLKERPVGFLLVDVRPAADFAKGHLPGAINILDEEIGKHAAELHKASNIVFYCNSGSRSAVAYYAANDLGIKTSRFFNKTLDIKADGSFEIR